MVPEPGFVKRVHDPNEEFEFRKAPNLHMKKQMKIIKRILPNKEDVSVDDDSEDELE